MPSLALILILATWAQRLWEALYPLARVTLGWSCIIVGLAVTISPIPFGFIVVVAGVALLGVRDRGLRRARVAWKLLLRRWATARDPRLRAAGLRLRHAQRALDRRFRARHNAAQRARP